MLTAGGPPIYLQGRRNPITPSLALPSWLSSLSSKPRPSSFPPLDAAILLPLASLSSAANADWPFAPPKLSHKKAAATATGLCRLLCLPRRRHAGGPLGALVKTSGWMLPLHAFDLRLLGALIVLPLWTVKKREVVPQPKETDRAFLKTISLKESDSN